MNTPNNAAALERLEAMESQMREWITAEVEPDLDRIEQWANDLATLRATLAQPDAALDRLEQKWREEAAAEWTHCQNKELSEWVRDRCYGQHNRLLSCADELATLRATLHPSRTPPHEHPKQRSGSDTSSRENNQHGMAKP